MKPSSTELKILVFAVGTLAMVMFPPTVETWIALTPEIPEKVLHGFDFIGMVGFGHKMGPEGYSIEINWSRLALQISGLAFVLAAIRRPHAIVDSRVFP